MELFKRARTSTSGRSRVKILSIVDGCHLTELFSSPSKRSVGDTIRRAVD
jgi:hypothetical protein